MTPVVYLILGLIGGGLLAAAVFFLARRARSGGFDVQTELVRRLEMIDRGLRDEFEVELGTGETGYLTEAAERLGIRTHLILLCQLLRRTGIDVSL